MSLREGWEQCQETLPQRSCISLVKATSHRTHTRAAWPTWVSCEGQRDKTVSVCDWVNTQHLLCVRTNWVTHVQRFCFLFSLPRSSPRHRPLSGVNPFQGALHKEKRTLPRAPAGFSRLVALPHWMPRGTRLPFSEGACLALRTVWPMFNCCSRAKVLKDVTNRKKEATGIFAGPCSLGEQHKISNS